MKPSLKYKEFMQQSAFKQDQAQQHTVFLLDRLYLDISDNLPAAKGVGKGVKRLFGFQPPVIQGLYLWGGVGRGKTFLMDIFFEALPVRNKTRLHFHQFMQQIHNDLSQRIKIKDPIREMARAIALNTGVLCLDEFVVNDIGDAMLIGRLLQALFAEGVVLVATSNTPPEELYRDGLQRSSFIPAIEQIVRHCHISNLDGGQDYRALGLKQTRLFQVPHSLEAVNSIKDYLDTHLVAVKRHDSLLINGRSVRFEFCAEDTIWFRFDEICKTSRSRFDYLEIACLFNTVIITGIEAMDDGKADVARRFVSLIDVFYDRRVKLICTSEVVVEELYQHEFLAFEFRRTVSRLLEMQSLEYIGQTHFV